MTRLLMLCLLAPLISACGSSPYPTEVHRSTQTQLGSWAPHASTPILLTTQSHQGVLHKTVSLDHNDNGSTVTLQQGDTLTITLPANPTTGYTWNLSLPSNSAAIKQSKEPVFKRGPGSGELGGGGTLTMTFQACLPGTVPVILSYRRPTDDASKTLWTFTLTVTVSPGTS